MASWSKIHYYRYLRSQITVTRISHQTVTWFFATCLPAATKMCRQDHPPEGAKLTNGSNGIQDGTCMSYAFYPGLILLTTRKAGDCGSPISGQDGTLQMSHFASRDSLSAWRSFLRITLEFWRVCHPFFLWSLQVQTGTTICGSLSLLFPLFCPSDILTKSLPSGYRLPRKASTNMASQGILTGTAGQWGQRQGCENSQATSSSPCPSSLLSDFWAGPPVHLSCCMD